MRVAVDGIIGHTIKVYIGENDKPKIINRPIPDQIILENSVPLKISLSGYEYDRYDDGSKLTWSVTGIPYPCLAYINVASDELIIIPIEGEAGACFLTLTLRNSQGKTESESILVIVIGAPSSDEIYLGLWLATIAIINATIIAIYVRLKWLIKIKNEKELADDKKLVS